MDQAKTIQYKRPWLYPKQRDALFHDFRWGLIESTTKAGKTVGALAWLFEKALKCKNGQNLWWIAPIRAQAEIAFRRLCRGVPRDLYKANQSKLTITLVNGAVIWFLGSDNPDSLYGEDVYAAVIDEGSRCRQEAFFAVRSTLTATQGPIRIIGNVKGRKNWFYNLCRRAEQGMPDAKYAKITWKDAVEAKILAEKEVMDAKDKLPENVFRELYEAEPSDDSGNPFGLKAIAACCGPRSLADPIAFGIDLAKSTDWTWVIGIDADDCICFSERWQGPWNITKQRIIDIVGLTPALIDSTGVGDPIVEDVQKSCPNAEGYKFTSASKQQLMEGLAADIHQGLVHGVDDALRLELENFEYEFTKGGVRYCLAPETKVLTADLKWLPVGTIHPGTKLLAFDEYPAPGHRTRYWRTSIVESIDQKILPGYEITLADGTKITCSSQHLWLVEGGNKFFWITTEELRAPHPTSKSKRFAPHQLVKLADTWDSLTDYDAGYLAAAFDGEGCLTQKKRPDREKDWTLRMALAQKQNAFAAEIIRCLNKFNYQWACCSTSYTDVDSYSIVGGRIEILRALGELRPKRLLAKFNPDQIGQVVKRAKVPIISKRFVGDIAVTAIGTSTKTLIAEGFASHNSAPEGLHDDGVMAIGLARHRKRTASLGILAAYG